MPELPEVETVRRTLAPALGSRVTGLWTGRLPLRQKRPIDRRALRRAALGARLAGLRRLGKYLLLDFEESGAVVLCHLGMSGRLRLMKPEDPRAPHTHVVFFLEGPGRRRRELRYSDPRRFGFLAVARRGREREHPALAVLGVDPLEHGVSGALLYAKSRGSRRPLKGYLLDQRAVAGLGNIYVCEALWQAGVRPTLPAGRLSRPRWDRLAAAIGEVLLRALNNGGTSLRDFVAADGAQGDHSHYLWVYDREGQACPRPDCRGLIRRAVHQGRATFYCPSCQQR